MPLKPYLDALEVEISNLKIDKAPQGLYEPINYMMGLGGKRFRPCLTLLAANLWLYNWQKALKPALAVEMFHNFTLMHDDIMDQAPLRRGQTTVHEKWNVNSAILSGDVMLVKAYDLLNEIDDRLFKKVFKRFNQTASEVCEGQQLDMDYSINSTVSKDNYLEMIRLKTAVLLGFSLELGGIVAEADEESIVLLNQIGVNLGMGFQLKDDILDVYGNPEKFGKQIGGDIIENKKTWLLLDAIEKAKGTEYELVLEGLMNDKVIKADTKISKVLEIYEALNVKSNAESKMSKYFKEVNQAIGKLKISDDKKGLLRQISENLMNRES